MTDPRDHEITRPITVDPKGPGGATPQQLAQLDSGEISTLLVGRYLLEERLGKGGMSSVYHGEHLAGGVPVAIKMLTRTLGEHPHAFARFMNEVHLTAQVEHPNVVNVLDYGTTPEGLAFLVMPLYEGEDLRTTLRREGPLSWPRARTLMLQLCAALEAVHARSIVHRDIKPSNCLRVIEDGEERIKLLDFGVARKIDGAPEESVVGTPEYMSPEQARGEPVDARSDIYSLGIVFGELLTGRVPFEGQSVTAIFDRHAYERPPMLNQLADPEITLPIGVEAIYQRALAKRPIQRFASVREFAAALAAIDDERDRSSHWDPASRWQPLALAAGLALGVGLVSAWVSEAVSLRVFGH
jgi:serine/threonine protein kinase